MYFFLIVFLQASCFLDRFVRLFQMAISADMFSVYLSYSGCLTLAHRHARFQVGSRQPPIAQYSGGIIIDLIVCMCSSFKEFVVVVAADAAAVVVVIVVVCC